jgi:hypothetical protein
MPRNGSQDMNNKSLVDKRVFQSLQYVPLRNYSVTEGVSQISLVRPKPSHRVFFLRIDSRWNYMP